MASILLGSSTTQILFLSREGSLHISHGSRAVILKHMEQNRALSLTSVIALAMPFASEAGIVSIKNANRWAHFLPMPGSLVSCETRFSIIPCAKLFSEKITQPAHAGQLHAHSEFRHVLVHHLLGPSQGFVSCRQYQILKHLNIVGIDHIFFYFYRDKLPPAICNYGYHAAARSGLNSPLFCLLLHSLHLSLQLLGLTHYVAKHFLRHY